MIAPHQVSKFAGLFDSSNPYKVAPEGAASIADNCVVRSVDTLSPRPGYAAVAVGATADAIGFKDGSALALTWDDTTRGVTGKLQAVNLSTGVRSTMPMTPGALPFSAPGGSGFTRFVSANKSVYFQSRYGLTKVESISSGICRAALQPAGWSGASTAGLVLAEADAASGSVGWLAVGARVAYRYTICRNGANAELIESEPSERFIGTNTFGFAAAQQVTIAPSFMIPQDAFMRIYRTKQVAAGIDPGDELFLVAETTATFVADVNGYRRTFTGSVLYLDQTPDTSLTVPLYTNATSGSGIASANTSAPIAADMAYFKNRLLLLNTRDVERLTIKVLGTGTGGIVDGDSILVAGTKYTFRATPVINTNDVGLFTGGTVAQNIESTARALQTAVNVHSSQFSTLLPQVVFARYVSTGAADAGHVLLERLVPGADAITIQTSSKSGWDSDYTTPTKSDPNAQAAGLSWSAIDQPEGVPIANSAIVGDASVAGQRIIALKEACLIFKGDALKGDGLFRWTDDGSGDNSGVSISVADPTVRLLAPETAQALDNFVFALCDQGVLAFSEQGQHVDVSFDQIGKELQKLVAYVGLPTLAATAFAVVNQQEHEYILCLPESPGATSCTLQYVFNEKTKVWTRWTLPGVVSGAVDPVSGKVVWGFSSASTGPGAANSLWVERKNSDSTDYQDPGFTVACPVSTSTATMVFAGDLTSGVNAIAVGDAVEQAQTVQFLRKRVKAVSYASGAAQTTVTLDSAPATAWSTGQALTVRKAIQAVVKFLPWSAGEPLTEKKWSSIYFVYRTLDIDWITYQWASENLSTPAATEQIVGVSTGTEPLPPILLDLFASSAWGSPAWDRQTQNVVIRTTLPKEVASCALLGLQLTLACALEQWALCAIDAKLTEALPEPTR